MTELPLHLAAEQLHDAATELLLSLLDTEEDLHPETGQMYSSCAQAWLAVDNYRKQTGSSGGAIAAAILQKAINALEDEQTSMELPSSLLIRAECHSDDYVYNVEFDVAAWFEQASDGEIKALAGCNWGGDYPADSVAKFYEDKNPSLAILFDYVRRKEGCGFECYVDQTQGLTWLEANRPLLFNMQSD